MNTILNMYGFANDCKAEQFGSGLINNTYIVKCKHGQYILQKINHSVFNKPQDIADNIEMIDRFLKTHYPAYKFIAPAKTLDGRNLVHIDGDGYYRMIPFVEGSHSKDVVANADQAYEAAKQFGKFTHLLSGFNTKQLNIIIPDFHNLSLRFAQFQDALKFGNANRIHHAKDLIEALSNFKFIVDEFEKIKLNNEFKSRVTHHDTKISNVLFDDYDKAICVIDLDTVMPGYFISDVGDMMRTYLSPVSEEEKDFNKIEIRDDFYKAIVKGYLEEMGAVLTETEKQYFFYSGLYMIYMQALRFLTDYLNNDRYYGAKYEGHNFVRAGNQLTLLQRLYNKRDSLNAKNE